MLAKSVRFSYASENADNAARYFPIVASRGARHTGHMNFRHHQIAPTPMPDPMHLGVTRVHAPPHEGALSAGGMRYAACGQCLEWTTATLVVPASSGDEAVDAGEHHQRANVTSTFIPVLSGLVMRTVSAPARDTNAAAFASIDAGSLTVGMRLLHLHRLGGLGAEAAYHSIARQRLLRPGLLGGAEETFAERRRGPGLGDRMRHARLRVIPHGVTP